VERRAVCVEDEDGEQEHRQQRDAGVEKGTAATEEHRRI
jgi:hypothetical protein